MQRLAPCKVDITPDSTTTTQPTLTAQIQQAKVAGVELGKYEGEEGESV